MPNEIRRLRTTTHKLIFEHLDAAEKLLDDFPQYSLVMTTLALEESYKLKKLLHDQPMSENKWKKLIQGEKIHVRKIIGLFREAYEELQKMGPEKKQEYNENRSTLGIEISAEEIQKNKKYFEGFLKSLESLYDMKLDTFYAGWNFKCGDVRSITRILDPEELQLVASYMRDRAYALAIHMISKYLLFVEGDFLYLTNGMLPLRRELRFMRKKFYGCEHKQKLVKVISILKRYPKDLDFPRSGP